jgi:hypothetical protein
VANALQPVRPGDVISSDLINQILAQLQQLAAAIGTGQGQPAAVLITGFDPPGQIAVGQPLSILGTGFPSPPTAGTVTMVVTSQSGASAPTAVPLGNYMFGSSSTVLKFIVPAVTGVTSGSLPVTVSVFGASGSPAVASYTLLPSQASGPAASITTVTDTTTNVVNVLGIGHPIQILGQNFAPTPGTANVITFTFTPPGGGAQVTYPKSGQTLVINPASNASQVLVTVPAMTEITTTSGTVAASLSVANGNNTPAVVGVQLFQP